MKMTNNQKEINTYLEKKNLNNLSKICGNYQKQIFYRRCGYKYWSTYNPIGKVNPKTTYYYFKEIIGSINGPFYRINMNYYDTLQIKDVSINKLDDINIIY